MLQVVGYKNSGKTTLISSWIETLAKRNKSVAVIKHHSHDSQLNQPDSNVDSMRFMASGAISSLVCGSDLIQLHMRQSHSSLSQMLQLASMAAPDLILIEGFKEADYPKIVLIREAKDWLTLGKLSCIVGVITHENVILENIETIPRQRVDLTDMLLEKWMIGERNETI